MNAVGLDVTFDAVDILEDEREQRNSELLRECGVHRVELRDVVAAVLRRKRDAGESHSCSRALQALDHCGHIALCDEDGKTAQAVVAAELEDDDLRFARKDLVDAFEAVFCGVTADALVHNVVVVSGGIEQALQVRGIARS